MEGIVSGSFLTLVLLALWKLSQCKILLSTHQPVLQETASECENVTEIDIFNFFERNAPTSHWIRPVKRFRSSIGVTMELSIRSILGLDVLNQELFLTGFFFLTWTDEFRIWNTTSPLNCVDTVSLEFGVNTKIWTPDICFYNSYVI